MPSYRNAIVRPPSASFARGITAAGLGEPVLELALEQHSGYCAALEELGLSLTRLEPDPRYPDGTFVEDDAILTARGALLARPGAESRRGEVEEIREVVGRFFPAPEAIEAPGTLDGGDVCEAGERFFIGISRRTNEEGARQLADFLAKRGYASTFVDIRATEGLLHLKSGVAWVGEGRLVLIDALAGREEFKGHDAVRVEERETYAANCVRINDGVLVAAGHPVLERSLSRLGCRVLALEVSEYRKMDGGLSCLSLRF
jgi:dimethylargininase